MKTIPRWQQDFIVEKYFEEYHHLYPYAIDYLHLKSEDAFMLASFIYSGMFKLQELFFIYLGVHLYFSFILGHHEILPKTFIINSR